MKKGLKYTICFVFIIIGAFFCFENANAVEILEKAVLLDQATIEKGYTVETDEPAVRIGVQHDTFSEPAWVKIKREDNNQLELPVNQDLVSEIYVYDIRVKNPVVLDKVVWVALKIENYSESGEYQLVFHNRTINSWSFAPTTIVNGEARTGLPFPYSKVAVFKKPLPDPTVSAISAIIIDEKTGEILYEKNIDEQRSIASLTKLITASVFLDNDPDLNSLVVYDNKYETSPKGAHLYVADDDVMTLENIFYSTMVGSCNNAAKAIGYNTPNLTFNEVVAAMNQKATDLGLSKTQFLDPTGLNPGNQSTAYEYALLAREAFKYPLIAAGSTLQNYSFSEVSSADWRVDHSITSGNNLLFNGLYITGTKTGFLYESLYTYVVRSKDSQTGEEVIVVLLGNESKSDRWSDAKQLVSWGLDALNTR